METSVCADSVATVAAQLIEYVRREHMESAIRCAKRFVSKACHLWCSVVTPCNTDDGLYAATDTPPMICINEVDVLALPFCEWLLTTRALQRSSEVNLDMGDWRAAVNDLSTAEQDFEHAQSSMTFCTAPRVFRGDLDVGAVIDEGCSPPCQQRK